MKKISTFIIMAFMPFFMSSVFAQDTIVAWTFPPTSPKDSVANVAISINTNRYLNCQYGTWGKPSYYSIHSDTVMGANPPNKCMEASGWANCVDSAYWEVKFKTLGYGTLKLYSIQESDSINPGPKYFRVQYALPGGSSPWVDLVDTVTCSKNWSSGVVNGICLPSTCDNLSGQVGVRWLLESNKDINGNALLSTGINKIDNIIVTGLPSAVGIANLQSQNSVNIYPNPNNGNFFIDNNGEINKIAVYNILGKCVYTNEYITKSRIDLSGFEKGMYIIQITTKENEIITHKLIVE